MGGFQLAIDGPAGSGKSSISLRIAEYFGWTHIDTGAMYRAVTLYAIEHMLDLSKEDSYYFLENVAIEYKGHKISIDGADVTSKIRDQVVTSQVSLVSSFRYVRNKLVEIQRRIATGNVVMDGRDIGSVVLPKANLKIFLKANVEERAKRRHLEYLKKGINRNLDDIINDIIIRDEKDSNREESPLCLASDAVVIDTTYLTIDEVVLKIIELIKAEVEKDGRL